MSVGARAALLVALLVALLGAAVTGQAATVSTANPQVDTGEPANLTMVIDIQSDGDARWRVSTTFNLTSGAEREAFRRLAESFENGETATLGLDAFRRASSLASESTGREMTITDVTRRTSPEAVVENGTGRLTVQFTWTNFGYRDGNRLVVDDVFETEGGMWLSGLDRGETLVIRAPDGGAVVNANVPPRNGTLQWTGPERINASTLETEFTVQAGETPTQPPGQSSSSSLPLVLLFTFGVGGGVVVIYLLARRDGFEFPPTPAEGSDTDGSVESATTDEPPEATPEEPQEAGSAAIDEELLSDEERVERLLEQNGGRMKQANIVNETGWSNAKVSQLLSSMEEEGRIDKLRIGRENLISFPDEDVTDIKE